MRASFSRPALVLLLASAVALFALSVLLHAADDDPVSSGRKYRANTFSISAVGHAGLYDVLRRLDRPVSRSVGNTLAMVGSNGTLIVAEPELARISSDDGLKLLGAPRLLLVLPKWYGVQDAGRPAWVSSVDPVPLTTARQTLALVAGRSDVLRTAWPKDWKTNQLDLIPSDAGSGIVQLIRSREMRPIVGTDEGMLIGEMIEEGRKIWVLADPDILSNYGISSGDNAAFSVAMIDVLRLWRNTDDGAPVVFDETVHGYQEAQGSPIKLLFRFPFSIVTILTIITAVLLVLAGANRFGAARTPAPALDFGKKSLIDNSARLLDYGGHHAVVLKRYVRMTVRSVAHTLHAPPNLDEAALAAWLDRIGKARGIDASCAAILHTVAGLDTTDSKNLTRLFESARDIHRWKGEILNGSATRRRYR